VLQPVKIDADKAIKSRFVDFIELNSTKYARDQQFAEDPPFFAKFIITKGSMPMFSQRMGASPGLT
jgi:hypothetical protein